MPFADLLAPAVQGVLVAILLLVISQGIYRAYFHPLAHFPGPALAGLTLWWKAYVEVVQQVSMVDKLAELHKVYGKCRTVAKVFVPYAIVS
jgi:hypothetical protein